MSDAISQAMKEMREERQFEPNVAPKKLEDITDMLVRNATADKQFEIDTLVSANSALVDKNEAAEKLIAYLQTEHQKQVHKLQAANLSLRKQILEMKAEYSNLQGANIALEKQLWDVEFAQNADWLIAEGHFKIEKPTEGK